MDLLTNAVQSIQLGVEDYSDGSSPRLLSAIRNIHSGVLLLYKEALRRLSPTDSNDVLIKAKVTPSRDKSGNVVFIGSGKKTVDALQIRERFEALGIATDWKRLQRLAEARNDLEHYFPRLEKQALHGLISDAFLLVRSFVSDELGADPRILLGEDTWQNMLGVSEVYEAEKKRCMELLDQIEWESEVLDAGLKELSCESCGSELLKPDSLLKTYQDVHLICSSCGLSESFESFIPRAVAAALHWDAYVAAKEGDHCPYVSCPECGLETYVIEENRCVSCGESIETTCIRCGGEIIPEELDCSPMCGWCSHMSLKDD